MRIPHLRLALVLGAASFFIALNAHSVADGDLWGKLAIGAHVWRFGTVPERDVFAFTPVLPRYIEHEWGAGTIFFGAIKAFGPAGLLLLRMALAFGALGSAYAAGQRGGCRREVLLLLAVPAAWCLLLGYIPVVRSHAFTYCFFAVTLWGLEELRAGNRWPLGVLPPLLLVWSNVHGGFVAGLGAMGVYSVFALLRRERQAAFLGTTLAAAALTLVNIYGLEFWPYLIPALLHKRPLIAEWQPLPVFAHDLFTPFRLLFAIVLVALCLGWRRVDRKNWPGLVMLALTAVLAWQSRRHAPFFAVAALAYAGPFFPQGLARPAAVAAVYGAVALGVAVWRLPLARWDVVTPLGHDPVREVDILAQAAATGNLATPFNWGCYCAWRLYPRILISMDGRYETTYPESTFALNNDFYGKRGTDWDRLLREYTVDYVILQYRGEPLRPADLLERGYVLVWETAGHSALLALPAHAEKLRRVAAALPDTTPEPLDAQIPDAWWRR